MRRLSAASKGAVALSLLFALIIVVSLANTNTIPFNGLVAPTGTSKPGSPGISTQQGQSINAEGTPVALSPKIELLISGPIELSNTGENKAVRFSIANLSDEALEIQFFLLELSQCQGSAYPANCLSLVRINEDLPNLFVEQFSVEAGELVQLMAEYHAPGSTKAVEGTLVVIGGNLRTSIPVSYEPEPPTTSAETDENTGQSAPDATASAINLLRFVVGLLLFAIIAALFYYQFYPSLFPVAAGAFAADIAADDADGKLLWKLFSSTLRDLPGGPTFTLIPPIVSGDIDLPTNLASESSYLKTILALLSWLIPKTGYVMRLAALQSKEKGAGLNFSLIYNRTGKVETEKTFWAGDYLLPKTESEAEKIDTDTYGKLMVPAIYWFEEQLRKMGFVFRGVAQDNLEQETWESKAYFKLGSDSWSADHDLGQSLINRGLLSWPDKPQAFALLGRIWIEKSQEEDLDKEMVRDFQDLAVDYLDAALSVFGKRAIDNLDMEKGGPQAWFAASYNRAVANLYRGQTEGLVTQVEDITKDAKSLWLEVSEVLNKQAQLPAGHDFEHNPDFTTALKSWSDGDNSKKEDLRIWLEGFLPLLVFFQQSSKLVIAQAGSEMFSKQNLIDQVNTTLSELRKVLARPPGADGLFVQTNYRVHFNAACYYSRAYSAAKKLEAADLMKTYSEIALAYLEMAVAHGGGLAAYARKDKPLAVLKADYKDRFDLIAPPEKKEEKKEEEAAKPSTTNVFLQSDDEDVLEALPGMTDAILKKLNDLSIYTGADLLQNGIRPEQRRDLIAKTGIASAQLMTWLSAIDLLRVDTMTLAEALMLILAGEVDTVKELGGRQADELSKAITKQIPKERLTTLIAAAKTLIPTIERQLMLLGLDEDQLAALNKLSIYTTEELLQAGATPKQRRALAKKLPKIDEKGLLKYLNYCDLMRIEGITADAAKHLEGAPAGVDTIKELRNRDPQHLYIALKQATDNKEVYSRTMVSEWVKIAKELIPVLQYD